MPSSDADDSETWLLELINYNRQVHWPQFNAKSCASLYPWQNV